jgi:hypothetical protein
MTDIARFPQCALFRAEAVAKSVDGRTRIDRRLIFSLARSIGAELTFIRTILACWSLISNEESRCAWLPVPLWIDLPTPTPNLL